MAERSRGLYSVLSHPKIYQAVQNAFGAPAKRRTFVRNFVKPNPGDRILDIGCGPADILNSLSDVVYIGYEPNATYVERARHAFGDRAEFHVGLFDNAAARHVGAVDIALVSAVLHHLADDEVIHLLQLLRTVLRSGGRLVTLDCAFVDGQNPISRLLASLDRGKHVRTPAGYLSLVRAVFPQAEGTVIHYTFPPYTHWIMTAAA